MSVAISDPTLTREDRTRGVIDEAQMALPPKEVVEAPLFLSGRDEASPPQEQTALANGWFKKFRSPRGLMALAAIGLAIYYVITL